MHESEGQFLHRAVIIRTRTLPTCTDCGKPSTVELLEVTKMGDPAPVFLEVAANKCPDGPHVQLRVE